MGVSLAKQALLLVVLLLLLFSGSLSGVIVCALCSIVKTFLMVILSGLCACFLCDSSLCIVKYYNNCRPNSTKDEEASTTSLFNKMRAPFILKNIFP
jgi:hypothetical protein